jgi:geranylgeranyl pyrophosphate synthase
VLGGSDDTTSNLAYGFGRNLGLAFQVFDCNVAYR